MVWHAGCWLTQVTSGQLLGFMGEKTMKLWKLMRRSATRLVLLGTLFAITLGLLLAGQSSEASDPQPDGDRVIVLYVRQSKVIRAPWPVARVSVADPKVADVQMLTAGEVLLLGKAVGSTDLTMWSKGEESWKARVDVQVDLRQMQTALSRYFPQSRLILSQIEDVTVIAGRLSRAEHASQLHKLLDAVGLKYTDMTTVAGVHQVQLQVRFAEVSRTAFRVLGINAFWTGNDLFGASLAGSAAGGPINPISIGLPASTSATMANQPFQFTSAATVNSSVTVLGGLPRLGLELFVQALAENEYLRILAEPTLIALSGEEASFLAGGEFPIPIAQGGGSGENATISIEYREFGIRLRFRPTVLGDGRIRLFVAPEVSETSSILGVESGGVSVPSILTRKAETTLELKSGQTFAMAGLIRRKNSGTRSRVPGMGDLPILGALFRSARYKREETELVVLVTATLIEPMSLAQAPLVPGYLHTPPDDWELYALGLIEGQGTVSRLSPNQAAWLKRSGLHRLKGPGAWVTYDSRPAKSTALRVPSTQPSDSVSKEAPGGS